MNKIFEQMFGDLADTLKKVFKTPATPKTPNLTNREFILYDLLTGAALGIREGVASFIKAGAKVGSLIAKGLADVFRKATEQLQKVFDPLLSLRTLQEGSQALNREAYIAAQGVNLLGLTVQESQARAAETVRAIEIEGIGSGLNRQEMDSIATAIASIPAGVTDSLRLTQTELARELARATALAGDLGGGTGASLAQLVQKISTGQISNVDATKAYADPILSRFFDPRQGRALTGVADVDINTILEVFDELNAEIGKYNILENNPQRAIDQFFNSLYNPRVGMFGVLREFELDGDTTNTLTQAVQTMRSTFDKLGEFIVGVAQRILGGTSYEPFEALGIIIDRIGQYIDEIDVDAVLSNFNDFWSFISRVFSQDNINDLDGVLNNLTSTFNEFIDFFDKFGGAFKVAALGLVAAFLGLPAAIVSLFVWDAEPGEKIKGALKGLVVAMASLIAGNALQQLFLGFVRRGLMGMLGSFSIPTLGAAFTTLLPILGVAAAGFIAFSAALYVLGKDMDDVANALKAIPDAIKFTAQAIKDALSDLVTTFKIVSNPSNWRPGGLQAAFQAERDRKEQERMQAVVAQRQELKIVQQINTTGLQSGADLNKLFTNATKLTNNYAGDTVAYNQLVNELNNAIITERMNAPLGATPIIDVLNDTEVVFNREQLAALPAKITQGFDTGITRPQLGSTLLTPPAIEKGRISPPTVNNSNNITKNFSPNINLTINPSPGQDERTIADMVIERLNQYFSEAENAVLGA